MLKVNTARIAEFTWPSPEGEIIGAGKEISEELGRKPDSTDLNERHPFDVEICRIPPGKTPYTYHSHSAQWEFYHVISGSGVVRHTEGTTPIEAGDAFLFKPNEPHQITNDGAQDLILYVVADNPLGESYYHPDSNEWTVPIPKRRIIRPAAREHHEGARNKPPPNHALSLSPLDREAYWKHSSWRSRESDQQRSSGIPCHGRK